MKTNVATIPIDPLERLAAEFRAAGHPVEQITMTDDGWVRGDTPDAVAMEGCVERQFFAPVIRWRLTDGRRFFGKPHIHLTRHRVRKYFGLVDYEVVQEDRREMMDGIKALILESCAAALEAKP